MQRIEPVRRLADVHSVVQVEPLSPEFQDFYTDLSRGRSTDDLEYLKDCLEKAGHSGDRFAKIAFTGHRGCGKSTELLRIQDELKRRFTSITFVATNTEVLADYDYADLFLDLTHRIIREFAERKLPLSQKLAEDIAGWFATVSFKELETVKRDISLTTEAEAKAKYGIFGLSVALLAKVKSMVSGSKENRQEVRRELQRDPDELLRRFNLLLHEAQAALKKAGEPDQLLLVVDNLDRLTPEVARTLFFNSGDFLKMPDAHIIYTVPIASSISPSNIATVFASSYVLPMVKVRKRDGGPNRPAIEAMVEVVSKRMDVDAVFKTRAVVRTLVLESGGSIRDLMRLLDYAQQAAKVRGEHQIDAAAAKRAGLKIRLDYERLLIPAASFYPYLARIHRDKNDGISADDRRDPKKDSEAREFFSQLLYNGSVLEYNGDRCWYDVHPVILEIEAFQKALAALPVEAP